MFRSIGKSSRCVGVTTESAISGCRQNAFQYARSVADSSLTSTQRELFPMLQRMVATPQRERENSQWQFGYPVPFDPKASQRPVPRRGD